jgi:hypothetical protein
MSDQSNEKALLERAEQERLAVWKAHEGAMLGREALIAIDHAHLDVHERLVLGQAIARIDTLESSLQTRLRQLQQVAPVDAAQIEFDRLASAWRADTRAVSSLTQMVNHPAYQQIIAMGPRAVAPILREMSREPGHWGPALHAITGAKPVPPEHEGQLKLVAAAWLKWAREQGHRW